MFHPPSEFILGRLYANVLLASLNERKSGMEDPEPSGPTGGVQGAQGWSDTGNPTFDKQLKKIVGDPETNASGSEGNREREQG